MAKLERSAGRTLFAPVTFRLALKLEQVVWTEFADSAAEAVFALRATQRLFKQDVIFAWFDTWLEAEAGGVAVERDALGRVVNEPQPPALLPTADGSRASPWGAWCRCIPNSRSSASCCVRAGPSLQKNRWRLSPIRYFSSFSISGRSWNRSPTRP